ncbi:MAG: FAD-dependent oxidoreductase [Gammaproteobacteria bacterium]|nr:FAD-dependent oxidoreductase [Gammaproteobacteria bacterium]
MPRTNNESGDLVECRHLIIGGGIIGCSIAYHLAAAGERDIVLLEKSALTHGATWHAAGLVGQLRSSRNTTRMLQQSVELYDRLEAETGQAIDWKKTGSLRLACSPERVQEIRRLATMARSFSLEMHIISGAEAHDLFPLIDPGPVLAAAWVPSDGHVDPAGLCQALARGARQRGATIIQGEKVVDAKRRAGRIQCVVTNRTVYRADNVVLAAGMWSREIGGMLGVNIPACAVEHQYIVTEPIPDMPPGLPTLRDPDRLVYYKPDAGGRLVIGGYEDDTVPFGERGIDGEFDQQLLPENLERFEPLAELAGQVTPIVNRVGVNRFINGPIPYSADGDFVMGRAPGMSNLFVSTGFLYGIAAGGGAGKMMAEWIIDGRPSLDLWPLDIRRFSFLHGTRAFMYPRAVEHYGHHYKMRYPGQESEAARGLRRSPVYGLLKRQGAVYGSKNGWERPNWFAPEGVEAIDRHGFDAANWTPYVETEHHAVRNRVALIDQTSFSKLELRGPGALDAIQTLTVSNMDKPVGSAIYTQLCNEHGGVEADVTVTRTATDCFYIVTGSAFGVHDSDWIESHLPRDGSAYLIDVTSGRAVLNLCGPRARDVLSAVVEEDVSGAVFPFAAAHPLTLGAAPVLAVRIGFVGELGWELHVPTEFAAYAWERLWEAGLAHDIANAGYRAIESLRLEKGYLYWSADITPDYTPVEAGLSGRVHLKAKGDFIGRAVLERQKREGPPRRLGRLVSDRRLPVSGGETLLSNGEVVGLVTSAGYGPTIERSVLYGYLPASLDTIEDFEIEAFGERHPVRRGTATIYDPQNQRLKS